MDGRRIGALAGLCAALICGDALAQPGPPQTVLNDAGRPTDRLHVTHDDADGQAVHAWTWREGSPEGFAPE